MTMRRAAVFACILGLVAGTPRSADSNLDLARQAFEHHPSVETAIALAGEFFRRDAAPEGLAYFAAARENDDAFLRACRRTGTAAMYHYAGQWKEAMPIYEEAQEAFFDVGDEHNAAACMINAGILRFTLGEYAEAEKILERHLALCLQFGWPRGEALVRSHLGGVRSLLGDYEGARAMLQEALALSEREGDLPKTAHALLMLGRLYDQTGESEKAIRAYTESLALARMLGDTGGVANILLSTGMAHERLGNRPLARRFYTESVEMFDSLKTRFGIVYAQINLGKVLLGDGDADGALALYESAARTAEKYGDTYGQAAVYFYMGGLHRARGEHDKALAAFQACRAFAERTGLPEPQVDTLTSEAHLMVIAGRPKDGLAPAEQALAVARELDSPERLFEAHTTLGLVCAAMGTRETATQHFRAAIDVAESMRALLAESEHKSGFLGTKLGAYEGLVELLMAVGDEGLGIGKQETASDSSLTGPRTLNPNASAFAEAFAVAERMKARAFLDELGAAKFSRAGVPEELLQEKRLLEARMKWLRERR